MKNKIHKNLNLGYLLEKEKSVEELTLESYKRPLRTLDDSLKFFMKTLGLALNIHESTTNNQLKEYCRFYLTVGNSIIHMIRISREALVKGYYGNIAVLFRTINNYLNMSIYIHHHPEDVSLLIHESREDFKNNKEYKKKFHEFSLKKNLKELGYSIPDEYDDYAKVTHGSLWGAQVFGYKSLKMAEDKYELKYSPAFSIVQASSYLSLLIVLPVDFTTYFIEHLMQYKMIDLKDIIKERRKIDDEIDLALHALEEAYKFLKFAPPEVQKTFEKRLKGKK